MLPELRRLDQFVAVADEGSFTGAADRLHLSQQALSSSVRQLESEFGTPLFLRQGRRITLTPAGAALLREARPLLAAARTVRAHVQEVAHGQQPWLVGYTPAFSGMEVYELIEPAITAFPEVSFTLRQLYPRDLSEAVADGTIDLGLRRGVSPPNDLAAAVIGYHRIQVAIPAEHRLAGAAHIHITDLANERLALWAPPGASYFSDFLMDACRHAGFEPNYVVSRVQGSAMVAAPLTTGAAAMVTDPAGPAMDSRVQVVNLEPKLVAPVQAIWQRHTYSAVRETLINPGR